MAASGPASELIEATATSIGAGMLLGGFVASLLSVVLGLDSSAREQAVVDWSAFAGLAVAAILAAEALFG